MSDNFIYIKEYCKVCYLKKKYNLLKFENNFKKCESSNCNSSSPFYASAKKPEEFVRDFRNSVEKSSNTVSKCKNEKCNLGVNGCSFAHNDFEYFMWNHMKTRQIYKISEIYKEFVEPFIYTSNNESNESNPRVISPNPVNYPMYMINQVPQSKTENEIIQQDEKKKHYLCWFCLKEVSSENNILNHISSKRHQAYYEADKKRQWYFKMPVSLNISLKNTIEEFNSSSPHSEDECQEMHARIKFRDFMCSYEVEHIEKKIYSWPKWMQMKMPKFPSNLKSYKSPIQIFVTISINAYKCTNFQIYLRDDESRPFFKLIKANENQNIEHRGQSLSMSLNSYEHPYVIEFGIEFNPMYSSTYRQRLEFELEMEKGKFSYCKSIRIDVGTKEHLERFKELWEKYKNVIKQKLEFKSYVPFNIMEKYRRGIMKEELLENVLKVVSNKNWINTTVESSNYCDWMRDMMILEELEQRLILSKLVFHGTMKLKNHLQTSAGYYPANDGKIFGVINFQPNHDWAAREIVIKNVTNCYVVFGKFNSFLFECELIDLFRYKTESRSIDSVTICLSKLTVETVELKPDTELMVRIYFSFDRLVFDRRHESLKNIPKYDKLSYNPLVCPFFTRLPYGDDESKIIFNPKIKLNEEQLKLPRLVLRSLDTTEIALPFILNGAFGTGKSMVFAETVMTILKNDVNSSTLICTRSYSAGDIYLEIFRKFIPNSMDKIKLIKSFHKKGDKKEPDTTIFSDDLKETTFYKNRVFITTIENAVDALTPYIREFKNRSMFNYIFVDEAAQVLEVDAVMVYQFGNQKTKFIFAGDIFQTRPELFNRELKKFSVPIICRLYNTYKLLSNYTICLMQVYRTHPKIVEYLSKAIYYETPLTSLMKPVFPKLKPMKFIDSNDCQCNVTQIFDENLCSFKNEIEIDIILKELLLLKKNPNITVDDDKILVCSPFFAQVKLMRDKLRAQKFNRIVVDQPSNIQGREFDVVFISTVLTEKVDENIPILHPTFHSNKNLINLVISRTKHFVEVIGDKSSLITNNPTCKQWQKFIEMCNDLDKEYK